MMPHTQPPTPPQHQPERICAFYSKGPHFVRMLKRLREDYPDEIIVAAIPESFPYPAIARLANETIRLPDPGCLGVVRRGWTTLRRLRRVRCGHLVVMFDSPRLNLLARLSGTGRGWCYTVDGRLFVLNQPLLTLLIRPILDRLRGELQYRRAHVGTRRRSRQKD